MTAAHIREAGEALFGPRFQTDLARLLGVSDRTVRRWCAGEWEPRPFVWQALRLAMDERLDAIKQARKRLPKQAD